MSTITTPTTAQLAQQFVDDMAAKTQQSIPEKAFLRVQAKVFAAAQVLLFKYAGWMFLQLFVRHASMDETEILGKKLRPLLEWGRLIGEPDPAPAVQAQLVVTVTVKNQTGSIPAGAQLLSSKTGVVYTVAFARALDAPSVPVTIRAASDQNGGDGSGTIGNLEIGDVVSFAGTVANVATDAVVASVAVTGADAEDVEAYRARVMGRFANRPQGGALADYRQWALEVPGIAHAYPYAGAPGEIDVYVEADSTNVNPDGIPTQDQLDAVVASINLDVGGLASRRPVNRWVNALPIRLAKFYVTLANISGIADTLALKDAVTLALNEYLRSLEPFIAGLSSLPRNDLVTYADLVGVIGSIARARGGTVALIVISEARGPLTLRSLEPGEKARIGLVSIG